MRLEQVHQTIEAARDQRARYLWDAVYAGIARALGQPRRRVATGELLVQRRKTRAKLATSG